jgi:hypothetical protein
MATPTNSNESRIAACLNELCAINLGGIASNNDLTGLIEDYFLDDAEGTDCDSSDDEFQGDKQGGFSRCENTL